MGALRRSAPGERAGECGRRPVAPAQSGVRRQGRADGREWHIDGTVVPHRPGDRHLTGPGDPWAEEFNVRGQWLGEGEAGRPYTFEGDGADGAGLSFLARVRSIAAGRDAVALP